MNTWKKTAALTAALAMTTTLGACGRGGDAGGEKDVKATLVISTLNNPFFVSVVDGAKEAAQDRSKGFNEGIKAYPDIEVVAQQAADFDRGKALDVMTNVLQGNSDIDGVYAANDEMALGVVAALKARNLAGQVKVVGNDGIGDALKAIEAGTMYSTHAESPFVLGKEVLGISLKVADGEKVEKNTVLQGRLVTKDQVADFCEFLTDEGDTDTCKGIS